MDGLVDQLSTRIGSRDGDSGVAHTLQRTMERRISSSDQVMLNAIDEIQRLCDVIHLPRTVSEMAKTVFKQTMMNEILPNKKEIDFFIAATIYYSCKVNQVPRTFLEISQLTGVEIKSITKYYQKVKLVHQREASGIISTSAVDLIPRYCNHLGLDMQFTRCSKDIACTVESQGILAGKNPITIASACIFMTTQLLGNHQTIQSISRVSGMSETTIRDAFQVLSGNRSGILVVSKDDMQMKIRPYSGCCTTFCSPHYFQDIRISMSLACSEFMPRYTV